MSTGERHAGATAASAVFSSACRAPSVSMYFDQFGNVRACCQNTGTLMGNITEQSIREIWTSANTRRMRAALAVDDYSEGCGFCAWQVEQGDHDIVFARIFDDHPVTGDPPPWPVQMEFSMTNSCNLQCVMCNGDWSSSIRTHREQRPPLPEVYTDAFFDELAEFLPHLHKTNFLGGEPFLGKEPLRVLGMLADLDAPPDVAVTTNGTQWTPRIEAICERLPISFAVSIDGITKDTYESIRVGADFDVVMANLERFQTYARAHGTSVSIAHCFMRPNWHEFADLLRFAEDHDLDVGMNEVLFPVELSLFQLPADELRHVVTTMETDRTAATLTRHRHIWDGQLAALQHRLHALDNGTFTIVSPWTDRTTDTHQNWHELAVDILTEWSGDQEALAWIAIDGATGRAAAERVPAGPAGGILERAVEAHRSGSPVDLLDELTALLGSQFSATPNHQDFVEEIVIRSDGPEPLEIRATWSPIDSDHCSVVVAFRLFGVIEDAAAAISEWAGGSEPIVLRCDEAEIVQSVDGPAGTLFPDGAASLVGRHSLQALVQVSSEFGVGPELSIGPSGHVNDRIAHFRDGDSNTLLVLRSITNHQDDHVDITIGVRPAQSVE